MVGLLDVKIFVLRDYYLFNTTICLCFTTEVNHLTPQSDIKIERVGAVKIDIRINTAYVSISQSQCLVKCRPERALGVLSKTIKRRPVFRKRRGELDIED